MSKFITLLLIIFTQCNAYSADKTVNEWSHSGIDLNFYKSNVLIQNCISKEQVYMGCILSYRELLKSINSKLDIISTQNIDLQNHKIVFKTQNLAIIELKTEPLQENSSKELTQKDLFKLYFNYHTDIKAAYLPMFEAIKQQSGQDLEKILTSIENMSASRLQEKTIAQALNVYFHTASDPHSDFRLIEGMMESEKESAISSTRIGINYNIEKNALKIVDIEKNSAAAEAGLEVNDTIISINDMPLNQENFSEFSKIISQNKDQKLKLVIKKYKTQESQTIYLKPKTEVIYKVVDGQILELFDKKIGYIKYLNFMYKQGCEDIKKYLIEFNKNNVDGLIFDLRDNGGGSVQISQCVSGLFLGENQIISYFDTSISKSNTPPLISYSTGQKVFSKPMTLLINAYSASASELVAGALRDHNRAIIIGQTSFGKGSSQGPLVDQYGQPIEINKKVSFYITNGLFYQPSGKSNQNLGISPHISVYKNPENFESEEYALREKDLFLYPLKTRFFLGAQQMSDANTLKIPNECIKNKNTHSIYEQQDQSSLLKDFQLLTAASTLSCM